MVMDEFAMGELLEPRGHQLLAEVFACMPRDPDPAWSQPQPWLVDREWFQSARERLVRVVREFHQKQPLQPGIARQDPIVAAQLRQSQPFFWRATSYLKTICAEPMHHELMALGGRG